ncbi:hypothetical protein [Novosphingobium sp.]|uniref:hypothetical protein n=1 Tax=Novosphingobium sp. TaxID=1874826 RepID=UPI00286D7A4E|nr:hypothetical protein [Novosphingobium sp.]
MEVRKILVCALAALLAGVPIAAQAEQLEFDHRLYPPLKQVLDSGNSDMVAFDAKNPSRMVDLIAVRGKSAKTWTEALEIVAILPVPKVETAQAWMDIQRSAALARCPATFKVIAQDDISITYERQSPSCRAERAETGIYRLITGKRSWFQLTVLSKTPLDAAARDQWLALLASAHFK